MKNNQSSSIKISPSCSPLRSVKQSSSFIITPEYKRDQLAIKPSDPNTVDTISVNSYLEKIRTETHKLYSEKVQLKALKHNIKSKEVCLAEEKKEIEKQKRQLNEEVLHIKALRYQLSKEYAELKYEKFRHRAQKAILKSRQRWNTGVSTQILRHRKLLNSKVPEYQKKSITSHPIICLSESVKPISADSDSPPNESPTDTQEDE